MKTRDANRRDQRLLKPLRPVDPPVKPSRSTAPPPNVSAEELSRWIEMAKSMPDLRWDKVKTMRDALRSRAYDPDAHLADMMDALPDEMIEMLRSARPE